jgi:starch synthase
MSKTKPKILMASVEVDPLAKVGGLADVVPALSGALKEKGWEVRIIMPRYGFIKKKEWQLKKVTEPLKVNTNGRKEKVTVWQTSLPSSGVKVYLLDNKKYFGREKVYWGKESERFLFFSHAVLKVMPFIGYKPEIIHCHDFHTALIPDLIRVSPDFYYKNTKTLYTIHNLNHQGVSEIGVLSTGNLSKNSLRSLSRDARDGDINFMVQGIVNADAVNTVSPAYAREIETPEYGMGLEGVIKEYKDKISGILNGIDVNRFNPATDNNIYVNYTSRNLAKKKENKLLLQKELGLSQDVNIPMVGFVSRLVKQKGVDLLGEEIKNLECQFVILGTGQKRYEKQIKQWASKQPGKVGVQLKFDAALAQKIYAGSDIYLLPSGFEPCGLGQMIAMRYGTVPVVRATGGLKDTVDEKVGFSFKTYSEAALKRKLQQALNVYKKSPAKWRALQKAGMNRDFSWDRSADKYIELYRRIS